MYIRCSCSCALLLPIFGTLPLRHTSYKYHDKLVFVPSALHLSLVSEMSYRLLAYASWPIAATIIFCMNGPWHNGYAKNLQRLRTTSCNNTICFLLGMWTGNWMVCHRFITQVKYDKTGYQFVDFIQMLVLLNLYSRSDHRSHKLRQTIRGNDNLGK